MFPPPASSVVACAVIAIAVIALLTITTLGIRKPLLWRMAWREIVRRPGRTAAMLAGLTLSAVFVMAAFGLQDSFRASAVAYRLAQVGDIDEAVTGSFTTTQLSRTTAQIERSRSVRAVSDIYMSVGASLAVERAARTPASAYIYGVAPSFDSVYGPLVDQAGHAVAVSELSERQVFLSRSAAQRARAHAGQRITFGWDQITVTATVAAVLDNDPTFTTGELDLGTAIASVIVPLATLEHAFAQQYNQSLTPNTIAVRNIGPAGAHSRAVLAVLEGLFGVRAIDPASSHGTRAPTYFDETLIHPLQPTVVDYTGGLSQISNKAEYISSPAARQANWLQPAFTVLLVGSGLLLLALQCLLLAVERRAQLGISRAQGLQRRHVIAGLVVEGAVYALIASAIGIPLGALATAVEVAVLNHLPTVPLTGSAPFQFAQTNFETALRWQSAAVAGGVSLLAALAVVGIAAAAVSRTTIVTAIRNLGQPARPPQRLRRLVSTIWSPSPPVDGPVVDNYPRCETRARRWERRATAAGTLVTEFTLRGPLLLVGGAALVEIAGVESTPASLGLTIVSPNGIRSLGVSLVIAGVGLCLRWTAALLRSHAELARRLSVTLLGVGWLAYGLTTGEQFLRAMFAANLSDTGLNHTGPYSLLEILIDLLLPLAGLIVMVVRNADVPAALLPVVFRRIPALAPISRSSLAHPLTFRGRTGVTITLLGVVTFLITLLVASNAVVDQQLNAGGPYTAVLTAFLTGYLALGLIFGAFAIGVVASRAVVERRQEIGMLRALGFSRRLVGLGFVLETAFVTAIGVFPAAVLALGLVTEIARLNRERASFPALTIAALLAGAFLIAALAVSVAARQASRIPPAEALRIE